MPPKLPWEQEVLPVPRYQLLSASLAMQRLFYPNLLRLEVIGASDEIVLNQIQFLHSLLFAQLLIQKEATYRMHLAIHH